MREHFNINNCNIKTEESTLKVFNLEHVTLFIYLNTFLSVYYHASFNKHTTKMKLKLFLDHYYQFDRLKLENMIYSGRAR